MPENGQDAPVALNDTLIFALASGVEQHVILTAVGQDAYMWRGKVIEADTLLEAGRPIVVYDSLSVREGVTLSMAAGVQLYFHDGANLWVHGRIVAEGTVDRPGGVPWRPYRPDVRLPAIRQYAFPLGGHTVEGHEYGQPAEPCGHP